MIHIGSLGASAALIGTIAAYAQPVDAASTATTLDLPQYDAKRQVLTLHYHGNLPPFASDTLQNPHRVYFDFAAQTAIRGLLVRSLPKVGSLTQWSMAKRGQRQVRLVLQFDRATRVIAVHDAKSRQITFQTQTAVNDTTERLATAAPSSPAPAALKAAGSTAATQSPTAETARTQTLIQRHGNADLMYTVGPKTENSQRDTVIIKVKTNAYSELNVSRDPQEGLLRFSVSIKETPKRTSPAQTPSPAAKQTPKPASRPAKPAPRPTVTPSPSPRAVRLPLPRPTKRPIPSLAPGMVILTPPPEAPEPISLPSSEPSPSVTGPQSPIPTMPPAMESPSPTPIQAFDDNKWGEVSLKGLFLNGLSERGERANATNFNASSAGTSQGVRLLVPLASEWGLFADLDHQRSAISDEQTANLTGRIRQELEAVLGAAYAFKVAENTQILSFGYGVRTLANEAIQFSADPNSTNTIPGSSIPTPQGGDSLLNTPLALWHGPMLNLIGDYRVMDTVGLELNAGLGSYLFGHLSESASANNLLLRYGATPAVYCQFDAVRVSLGYGLVGLRSFDGTYAYQRNGPAARLGWRF
jgi:hypothetical protein